jgi:hypothetical protein
MLAYKDGPYALGLEWVQWMTGIASNPADPERIAVINVNQELATVTYFF